MSSLEVLSTFFASIINHVSSVIHYSLRGERKQRIFSLTRLIPSLMCDQVLLISDWSIFARRFKLFTSFRKLCLTVRYSSLCNPTRLESAKVFRHTVLHLSLEFEYLFRIWIITKKIIFQFIENLKTIIFLSNGL